MKNTIKKVAQSLLLVPALLLAVSFVTGPSVSAFDGGIGTGSAASKGDEQPSNLFEGDSPVFVTITNVLLFLIGAVSVIMLIYGGIRYTVSGGDSNSVTAAKNTILYAIVGIVVAILAFALVNFVITSFVAQ